MPKKICFFTTIPPLMYYVFVPKVFSTLDFVKKIPGEHDYKMFLQIQNKKVRSIYSLFCILKIFK